MSPRSPTIGNAWSNAFVCMSPYVELTVLQNWKVSTKKVREWCRQLCSQLKKVEIWRKAFSSSWNGHFSSSSSSPQPPQTISSLEPTHFFLWGGGAAHCTTVRTLKCCPENKTDSATYNGTKSPLTYLKYYCLVVIYCIRCVIVSSQPFHHIFRYIFTFSICDVMFQSMYYTLWVNSIHITHYQCTLDDMCVCNGKCGLHLKYHIRGNSPLLERKESIFPEKLLQREQEGWMDGWGYGWIIW